MSRSISILGFVAAAVFASSAPAAIITFTVPLDGRQEIFGPTTPTPGLPNAGDPDGSGTAVLRLDDRTSTIEWHITVQDIGGTVAAAHIHNAPAGTNGGIVIDFSGRLSGSTTDPDVLNVLANPSNYYVNVHTPTFPAGAVRGQIRVPEPAPLALMGLVMWLGWRRLSKMRS